MTQRKYEGVFIFPPDEGPDAVKEEDKRLEDAVTRFGGSILEKKDWGRRPLGFLIRKHSEGRTLLWNFEMEPRQVVELRKILLLDEKIIRMTLVRQHEIKQKPARRQKAPRPEKVDAGKS